MDPSWNRATVAQDSNDALVGVTLSDTYIVERVLGEGGMGRVYLARHTRIAQKRVAVKVLHHQYASNAEVLARFQREAEVAASVSHPNVVTVLDVSRTPSGLPYLVCEYLEGVDLSTHLKANGKLDLGRALYIVRQICRGLAAAHESGVVHRDLKPQNVFLVGDFSGAAPADPTVKILDFGLSRFLESSPEDQLTQSGVVMGTPSYMAPEQARAQPVDHRADVYGVGAILYTLLTGRPPFMEETPHATILAVLNQAPPPPRSLEQSIPEGVESIVNRALAREPSDRYPDARSLERAIEGYESQQLMPSLPPRIAILPEPALPVPQGSVGARVRVVLWVLVALALFLGAVVTSVNGVELATGYTFNRVEMALFVAAISGAFSTPVLIWLSRVRRHVFGNARELEELLADVRSVVLTFMLAYGLGMFALHLVDGGLARLLGSARKAPAGAGWAGWNLLLPVLALALAFGRLWLRRIDATVRPGLRRLLATWSVASLLVMAVGSIIVIGLHWRDRSQPPPSSIQRSP